MSIKNKKIKIGILWKLKHSRFLWESGYDDNNHNNLGELFTDEQIVILSKIDQPNGFGEEAYKVMSRLGIGFIPISDLL